MRIRIYYISVILILIQKSTSEAASRPSPPVSVSIHCDNYGVEVCWEYPDLSPDVHFLVEVEVSVYPNERKYTTRNLSLDISSMLFNSGHSVYYVTVWAVRGGQKSDSRTSDSFSFNEHATSDIKCYLDFPEVELSPKDGKLHIQFMNPLHLYRNTPALRNLTDNLEYTVETEEDSKDSTCEMKTKTCETSIGFSEFREEYCINLTGQIGQRRLNPRRSCFKGDLRIYPSFTVYLYPVLGVVLTLLFITGIILLLVTKYYSEIKKKSMAAFPTFLVFKPQTQTHPREPLRLDREAVAIDLHIEPREQTTLIEMSSDEEPYLGDEDVRSLDLDSLSPYGDNDLDETDSGGATIGYDCPHAIRLEMSPGDMVKGYGA